MVNETMTRPATVFGKSAPGARMTKCAALLIAVALSIPTFVVLTLVDLVFF